MADEEYVPVIIGYLLMKRTKKRLMRKQKAQLKNLKKIKLPIDIKFPIWYIITRSGEHLPTTPDPHPPLAQLVRALAL